MPQSGNTIASESISATQLALGSVITNRIADGAVTQAKVSANTLDATVAKNHAADDTEAGLMVVHYVLADSAGGADTTVTVTHAIRVIDVVVVNLAAGGAADTITVKNGSNAITDAIDTNKADKVVTRAGTIDDAYCRIAAGGSLVVSKADGANDPNCDVFVIAIRVT